MSMPTVLFLMSMILMLSWRPSDAFNCYSCTSLNSGCDDPFSSTGISTMNCPFNACLKTKTTAGGVQVVGRSCGTGVAAAAGCRDETVEGVTGIYCECTTDLCNMAAPVVTVTSLVGLTAVAALATAVVRAL
jgi:hypothetical protein